MYRLQNIAVRISAFSAYVATFLSPGNLFYWPCVLSIIINGAVSSVGCQGSSLSVEREWTKPLCQHDSASLASLNAGGLPHVGVIAVDCVCPRHSHDGPCGLACGLATLLTPSVAHPLARALQECAA